MATSSFYNDNLYRAYPFVSTDKTKIPSGWVVGIKACFDFGAGFSDFPAVFLTGWLTKNGRHNLQFTCEAENKRVQKTVSIPVIASCFERFVSEEHEDDETDAARIHIVLIVGNLPQENVNLSGIRLRVEPTRILWLQHRGISSVHVGNRPRNALPLPEGIEHAYYRKRRWWQQGDKFTGPLLFYSGFNCRIHSRALNRLQIEAAVAAGHGEVTEDISKGCIADFSTIVCEEPPIDYLRKDGLPDDENVLYAFCGAMGHHVQMISTSTVILTVKPEEHTVIISIGNLGGSVC